MQKKKKKNCFFCASDQKEQSVQASQGSGDHSWSEPSTQLQIHSGQPLGNHKPQRPRENTQKQEAGLIHSVKHIR